MKKVFLHNLTVTDIASGYIRDADQSDNFQICKFIGDGALLYFKSTGDNNPCKSALEVALKIRKQFEIINKNPMKYYDKHRLLTDKEKDEIGKDRSKKDWMQIHAKIGLDFGGVYFYTFDEVSAIPDPMGLIVDRASRVQSIAKEQQILITEDFWNGLKNDAGKPKVRIAKDWTQVLLRGVDSENIPTPINEILDNGTATKGVSDPSISPEYFFGTPQILDKFIEMKQNLIKESDSKNLEIDAIWIANWGNLDSYSVKEGKLYGNASMLDRNLIIKRLINKSTVNRDYLNNHLDELSKYNTENRNWGYFCKNTHVQTFELMLCLDNKQPISAMLTIHPEKSEPSKDKKEQSKTFHEEPSIGIYLDKIHGQGHVNVMLSLKKWFDHHWDSDEKDLYYGRQWGNPEKWHSLISPPSYEKFEEYITLEMSKLVSEIKIIPKFKPISLIEVGSGTGRVFLNLPKTIQDRITCMIGVDSSSEMIEYASKLVKNTRIKNKAFFMELDGRKLSDYVEAGELVKDKLYSKPELEEIRSIEEPFNNSTKIICLLMNTLGAIDEEDRAKVLRQMISAVGKDSIMILSFLNAESFCKYSLKFYSSLKEITGNFNKKSFDYKCSDFKTKSKYASHWFEKKEIRDLVSKLIGPKGQPKIEELADIGYFVKISL
ncbi:MAG: hypothetical protein ACREBB_00800 [Nitrosotalea sp.]